MSIMNVVSLVSMMIFAHYNMELVREYQTQYAVVASLTIATMMVGKVCDLILEIVPKHRDCDCDEEDEDIDDGDK